MSDVPEDQVTDRAGDTGSTGEPLEDQDQDGVLSDKDCDDRDPNRFPGALELCDGVDNDCDDVVDAPVLSWWPPLGAPSNLVNLETVGATVEGGVVVACPGAYDLGPGLRLGGSVQLRGRDRALDVAPTVTLDGPLLAEKGADIRVEHMALTAEAPSLVSSQGADWQLEWVVLDGAIVETLIDARGGDTFRLLNATVTNNQATASLLGIEAGEVEFFGTTMQDNRSAAPAIDVIAQSAAQADGLSMFDNDHGVSIRGGEIRWFAFESRGLTGDDPALAFLEPSGGVIWDLTIDGSAGAGLWLQWTSLGASTVEIERLVATGNQRGVVVDGGPSAATVTLHDSTVHGNGNGADAGAGIEVRGTYTAAYVTDGSISDNEALRGAGAWVRGGLLALDGVTVQRNVGDGVWLESGASLVYAASDFGIGSDANTPVDVGHAVGGASTDLGTDASGICADSGC